MGQLQTMVEITTTYERFSFLFFLDFLTLEDGTDRLSQNVGT
jgi:hypothetical protein